ncbi:MAG: DUF294 nucleotidyltransferase-like domain-containing protein, partial [Parachlamydia sp.]|nr:DUF294 nucleotidyltransferase-like domain-containing protein [Parachlamydia sp.]
MQPISLREGIDTQIGAQNEVAKIMAGISAQLQLSQQKMSALGAVLRQSHSASSSDSHLNPEPSQADQEGDFYKRLLKARQEKDAKGQSLWLEKLSELFLARGDFFKAANLLCGACVYARRDEKLRLFKKMEDVEKKYLQTLGCFSNEDHASRIQRQRLFLENQRRQLKQKIKEMDLSDLFMNMPGGLEKLHEVLQTITEYNKKLLEEIVNAAISYLGPPPVKWACMGMGSMARGEMSPYSDIEFAFLIDDASETSLQYFRSLSQCISIMVIHLGETKFPIFSGMDKKHPSVTPSGFSLDTGGNTPLGMPDLYELIGTSADLARFVDKDWIERSIILPNALSAVCLITGDARLVEFFEDERRKVLEQKKEGISNRDRLAYQLLSGHLKEFKPDLSMNKEALRAFGVKPELYRPFQEILGCLALRQSLREKSSVERIQALQRDKIFSDKGANSLRNAVININFLRVKAHLFYQDECDFYLLSVPGETDEKGMLYIDFEDHMRLERIYATLQEFHTCAMTFSQTKKIEVFSQSDFVRLTTREAASKMQALPKKIKGLGGYVMPSNVSMQNLTYEKVRAQLDKMDRQHIGEQEAYQKSLALNPNDWVSAFRLAEHEADHQQNEEALNHYLTASKAVPPDSLHEAAIYHRLANLYYGKNELQKARESLAKALRVQLPLYQQHKTNPAVQSPDVESDHFDVAYDFARMLDAAAGLELTLKNYPTAITYLVLMLEVLPKVKGSMAVHIPMDTIRKMELNCLDVLSVTYLACDKYEEATATTNRWSEAIAVRPGQYEGFEVKFDYVRIKRRLGRIALNQKN